MGKYYFHVEFGGNDETYLQSRIVTENLTSEEWPEFQQQAIALLVQYQAMMEMGDLGMLALERAARVKKALHVYVEKMEAGRKPDECALEFVRECEGIYGEYWSADARAAARE